MTKNSPGSGDWKSADDQPAAGPLIESYSQPGSGFERHEIWALGTLNVLLLNGDQEDAQAALTVSTPSSSGSQNFYPKAMSPS